MNQESLRQRFNPDGSLLRRQQMRMLEILLEVDKICKKHHIEYWLSSGTLIGAIRHKGFIPWDDDIDINITRENYNKLKTCILRDDSKLQFVDAEDDLLWISRIRLIDGENVVKDVRIDLLILDNAPNEPIKDKLQLFKSLMLQGMLKPRPILNTGSFIMRI